MKALVFKTLLCSATLISFSSNIFAADINSSDPSKVQSSLKQPLSAKSLKPKVYRKVEKAPKVRKSDKDDKLIKVESFSIQGAELYSKDELLEGYGNPVGQTVSYSYIQNLAQHIEDYYENNGYFLAEVLVSEKGLSEGIVSIVVFEGFIDKVNIEYNDNFPIGAKEHIKTYLNEITYHRPLHRDVYERATLLADELPGIELKVELHPSKTTVGAADLLVKLDSFDRYDLWAGFSNHVPVNNGPLLYNLGFAYYEPENRSKTTFTYSSSLKALRQRVQSISHARDIGYNGLNFDLTWQKVLTHPKSDVPGIKSNGATRVVTLKAQYPWYKSLRKSLYLLSSFGVSKTVNTSDNPLNSYKDRLRPFNFGVHYEFYDRFLASNILLPEITQGINIFNAHDKDQDLHSRSNGKTSFTKLNFSWFRNQYFPYGISFLSHLKCQLSFDPLLSSEEFGFGGLDFGRGYEPSTIVGDSGFAAKFELHYRKFFNKFIDNVDVFAFYDLGYGTNKISKISVNDVLRKDASGTCTGLGLRFETNKYVHGSLIVGKPLTFAGRGHKRDLKIWFEIIGSTNQRQ